MTPIQMPRRARPSLSTLIAGGTAATVGFLAAPALAQAAQTVAGGGPVTWESLGLGGLAVALSIWGMRESDKKRIEEAQRYADDLKQQAELRLGEEREHSAAIERIYAAKTETYRKLLETYDRGLQEKQKMIEDLLQRVLEGPRPGPSSVPGGDAA